MNNEHLYIIDTEEGVPKNRFPIVAQLGILGLVLVVLFGAFLMPGRDDESPQDVQTFKQVPDAQPIITPQKIEEVSLRAKSAYVFDVRAQRSLYSKNADEALPLASITKLMTALLSYELVDDTTQVTVPLSAVQVEGYSALSTGEKIGVPELRNLALVSSSNQAAHALAASVGTLLGSQDAVSQFVRGMNIRAEELQLHSLQFWNTTGLDVSAVQPGAVGSAKDVTFLMEYIIDNYPDIIAPTQEVTTRIYNTAGAYHEANNTNAVALKIPNMIGSKTGYTDLAGGNLTIAFDVGMNRPIIITVLGSTRDERFTDVLTLVDAVQKSIGVPYE